MNYITKQDLYISKSDIKKMEQGGQGIGYISIPDIIMYKYILVNKHTLQPITEDEVINSNSYRVCFIMK